MAFSLGSLTSYVNEQNNTLLVNAHYGFTTADLGITILRNVKTIEQLKKLAIDMPFQKNADCGWTTSGSTTITPRNISVTKFSAMQELCPGDLEQYSFQIMDRPGYQSSLENSIETSIANEIVASLTEKIEYNFWQGKSGATDGFAGILEQIDADVLVHTGITFNPADISLTATQITSGFTAMINQLPTALIMNSKREPITVFVAPEAYMNYTSKLAISTYGFGNLFTQEALAFKMPIVGTPAMVVAAPGLVGTNRCVVTIPSNLVYATDLIYEESNILVIDDIYQRNVKLSANLKAGTSYFYSEYISTNA